MEFLWYNNKAMLKKVLFACVCFSLFPLYAKTVKVGYYKDSGNFMSGVSASEPRAGYAYEYIQTVASYAGWECDYVYGEWDTLYPALLSGEIDVLADVSRTPERENLLLYPDYVMGQETYYLYSNDKNAKITPGDFSTWHGKKIALNKDYNYYDVFMEWQKGKNLGCEYVVFSGDDNYYDLFENHEFDMLLEIDMVAEGEWNPIARIGSSDFYLAVTASRPDLLSELNGALAQIFAMNPYYNNNLWLKYFTDTTIAKTLSPREEEWISAHPKINVGCMRADLPFAAFNEETGQAEGLVVEMLSYLSENLAGGKTECSYIFYDDTALMFSDLHNGIIDVVVPVYRDFNFAEEAGLIISEKITTISVGYASKKNADSEQIGKIAIPKRLRMPYYVKRNYTGFDTVLCNSYEECLNAVLNDECSAAVFNAYKMHGFINKNKKFRKLDVVELSAPCELSFVFARANRELLSIVNKMLMLIPSESISTDMDTFVMKEQGYTKKNFFMEYGLYIFLSVIAFIAIFISLMFALRRIREDMYFDPLTHLRNRRSLNGFITKFLRRASEKGEVFSLILFDLDNFKYLNDTYGHDFGDEVLVTAASTVKKVARRKDRVFRWGGEEVLILYKGTLSEAKEVAERARKEIESIPMQHEYETVHFTATVGVAAYENGMSYMDLFRRVDANLYKGKNSGKNQVVG
mgnify:CR=1 FL=1